MQSGNNSSLYFNISVLIPRFVEEFIQSPSNGLRLLLLLLKNLQVLSASPGGGVLNKEAARGTLKMEEYKKSMVRSVYWFSRNRVVIYTSAYLYRCCCLYFCMSIFSPLSLFVYIIIYIHNI